MRAELVNLEGGPHALERMEPAFLNAKQLCSFAGQRGDATSFGPGLVPRLNLDELRKNHMARESPAMRAGGSIFP